MRQFAMFIIMVVACCVGYAYAEGAAAAIPVERHEGIMHSPWWWIAAILAFVVLLGVGLDKVGHRKDG